LLFSMSPWLSFFTHFLCISRRVNRKITLCCACLTKGGELNIVTRLRRGLPHTLGWITKVGEGLSFAALPRPPLGPVYPFVKPIYHTFCAQELHLDQLQAHTVFCLMVTRCSCLGGKGVGAS
jgi:hypothetical protein